MIWKAKIIQHRYARSTLIYEHIFVIAPVIVARFSCQPVNYVSGHGLDWFQYLEKQEESNEPDESWEKCKPVASELIRFWF